MAVLPINSVNTGNHTLNFQGRKRKAEKNISEERYEQPNQAGKMVTIPVAVLMALATTSLNAKTPANQEFDRNIDQTELLAYVSPSEQSTTQQSGKTSDYYAQLNKLKKAGRVIKTIEVPGRESYTMVLLRDEALKEDETDCCTSIIMLPYKDKTSTQKITYLDVPKIIRLIYHDIGDNEFCGAMVERRTITNSEYHSDIQEIKLPDEAANIIIKLLADKSDYVNLTDIEFEKTTNANLIY